MLPQACTSYKKCDQQRLRPACAYAQSEQSLCWSLEYSMSVKLLTEQHLEWLCLKGGCTGLSESALVKMPHCLKWHVVAQIVTYYLEHYQTIKSSVIICSSLYPCTITSNMSKRRSWNILVSMSETPSHGDVLSLSNIMDVIKSWSGLSASSTCSTR